MSDFYGDYRDVEVLREEVQQKYRIIKDLNSRLAEAERLRDHYKERVKELEIANSQLRDISSDYSQDISPWAPCQSD